MQVFRTYLQSIGGGGGELFSSTFPKATVAGSTAASDPDRQQPWSHRVVSTVPMSGMKSRTLKLLAFNEKSTFDYFALIGAYKAGLAIYARIKQKQSKADFSSSM
jgi:hypothetical protein